MATSLLDLPPEIRLQIYEYVFPRSTHYFRATANIYHSRRAPGCVLSVALLRTCKLIYKEASPVVYNNTTFDIDICTSAKRVGSPTALIKPVDEFKPLQHLKKLCLRFACIAGEAYEGKDIPIVIDLLEAVGWSSGIQELELIFGRCRIHALRADLILDELLELDCSGIVTICVLDGSTWLTCSGYSALVKTFDGAKMYYLT